MIIVNYFGCPSAGKSTSAAGAFWYLKNKACNVEIVTEYAKQLVYSNREKELRNQIYIFAKQYKKVDDIYNYGKVPMVITDSALPLGLLYCEGVYYKEQIRALIWETFNSKDYENHNVLVKRVKPYNPSGRYQTEQESDALTDKLRNLGIEWHDEIEGDMKGQIKFAKKLYKLYGDRIKINNYE